MKKSILAFLAVLLTLGDPAFGREVQTKGDSGSLRLATLTEFGVDLDNPSRYGLAFSVPELALTYDLFGYQKITNRLKSDDPVGFIDLTLGEVQIRFANASQPDYNNPGQNMKLGFNDSAVGKTGYFGPLYLQNVRSGILWGDWIIQLGAGGTDSFWDPWHRESTGYGQMASSWAYLDTRVQYQRPLIPVVVKTPSVETNYWAYDTKADSEATGVDELSTSFPGAMVGIQYVGPELSAMWKIATNNTWQTASPNGLSSGLDVSYTPAASLKGFRVLSSVVVGLDQGASHDEGTVSGGVKVGYDLALPRSSVKISSVEPYVGFDLLKPFTGPAPTSAEASLGLTLHWPGMNGWGFDYLQGLEGRSGNVYSGATLALKTFAPNVDASENLKHSAQLTWYNDSDGGLINNIGSELVAQWKDFANADGNSTLMVTGYVDMPLPGVLGGSLVPWTKVYYDNVRTASMSDRANNLMIYGGFKLKKAIRNTEFGLTYQSRNILGSANSVDEKSGYGSVGIVKVSVAVSL